MTLLNKTLRISDYPINHLGDYAVCWPGKNDLGTKGFFFGTYVNDEYRGERLYTEVWLKKLEDVNDQQWDYFLNYKMND